MPADTSSAAAGSSARVGVAAAVCAAPSAEPIAAKSVAAASINCGAAITYDMFVPPKVSTGRVAGVANHFVLRCAATASTTRLMIDKLLVNHPSGCHDGFMRSGRVRLLERVSARFSGRRARRMSWRWPCAWDDNGIPVGQSSQTIEFGGTSRTFNLYRPQGLTGAVPLVVMLHGGFGNGAQAERAYHWDAEADNGHFLVAYPDGLNRAWNAGSCCGNPGRTERRRRRVHHRDGRRDPATDRPSIRPGSMPPACRTGP